MAVSDLPPRTTPPDYPPVPGTAAAPPPAGRVWSGGRVASAVVGVLVVLGAGTLLLVRSAGG
jgi:hypothetical protein